MKKLLLFIGLLFIPFIVKADYVKVDNFYMNATIEENGDLIVEEYFYASGDSYNGYERDIYYMNPDAYRFDPNMSSYGGSTIHNGSSIRLLDMKGLERTSSFSFDKLDEYKTEDFIESENPSNGDTYKYKLIYQSGGQGYRMYLPSSYNKAFYLKYKISNLAIKHNDVAELGWNIFNKNFIDDIDNLEVIVNVPNNKDEIRVWGHGPLNGKTEIINKNKVKLTISNLRANTAIDIRLTFDKDVIKKSNKLTNVSALDKILKYEESKAEQANYERAQQDKITEQRIIDELKEEPFYRSNYDRVKSLIYDLNNPELKKKYTKELESMEDIVDKNELKLMRDHIKYGRLSYSNYKEVYNNYDNLLNEELKDKVKIEVDNYLVKVKNKEKQRDNIGIITIIVLIITPLIYVIIYLKKKYSKFNHKYFREIPSLTPSGVDYLYNGKTTKNGISSVILDLIDQNKITLEKKNNSYNLTLVEKDNLTTIEKKATDIVFGTKTTVNTKHTSRASYSDFSSFQNNALKEIKSKSLLHKSKIDNSSIWWVFLLIISFMLPVFLVITIPVLLIYGLYKIAKSKKKYGFLFCLSIIISIIISIYIGSINHFYVNSVRLMFVDLLIIFCLSSYVSKKDKLDLTEEGTLELAKIKALRRYMKDFTILDKRELPEVRLWNKYLVYATALGVGKKVSKALKVYIESESLNTDLITNYAITNTISRSINNTMRSAYAAHYVATSGSSSGGSWSSGSGGGGGFSSGGGSFGGGSGGGHF